MNARAEFDVNVQLGKLAQQLDRFEVRGTSHSQDYLHHEFGELVRLISNYCENLCGDIDKEDQLKDVLRATLFRVKQRDPCVAVTLAAVGVKNCIWDSEFLVELGDIMLDSVDHVVGQKQELSPKALASLLTLAKSLPPERSSCIRVLPRIADAMCNSISQNMHVVNQAAYLAPAGSNLEDALVTKCEKIMDDCFRRRGDHAAMIYDLRAALRSAPPETTRDRLMCQRTTQKLEDVLEDWAEKELNHSMGYVEGDLRASGGPPIFEEIGVKFLLKHIPAYRERDPEKAVGILVYIIEENFSEVYYAALGELSGCIPLLEERDLEKAVNVARFVSERLLKENPLYQEAQDTYQRLREELKAETEEAQQRRREEAAIAKGAVTPGAFLHRFAPGS